MADSTTPCAHASFLAGGVTWRSQMDPNAAGVLHHELDHLVGR